jgi:hypothetical protein
MAFLDIREIAKTVRNTELTMKVFFSNYQRELIPIIRQNIYPSDF